MHSMYRQVTSSSGPSNYRVSCTSCTSCKSFRIRRDGRLEPEGSLSCMQPLQYLKPRVGQRTLGQWYHRHPSWAAGHPIDASNAGTMLSSSIRQTWTLRSCHQAAVPRGSICRYLRITFDVSANSSRVTHSAIPNSHISTGHERSEGGIFHHHSLPPTGVELT